MNEYLEIVSAIISLKEIEREKGLSPTQKRNLADLEAKRDALKSD